MHLGRAWGEYPARSRRSPDASRPLEVYTHFKSTVNEYAGLSDSLFRDMDEARLEIIVIGDE